jgi:hypothetical protein
MLGIGGNIQNDKIPKRAYTKGSVLLDGTNDYLKFDHGDGFIELISPANTNWSISYYFMVPGSGALGSAEMLTKIPNTSSYLWLNTTTGSDLHILGEYTEDSTSKKSINVIWDTNFVKGTWYHVVITSDRSGTNSDTLAYVNGDVATRSSQVTVASDITLTGAGGVDNLMSTHMGTLNIGPTHFVFTNIHFDEIAVWNSVLTANEITEIADKYPNLTQNVEDYASSANLLRYYRMGQDKSASAISIDDISGNRGAPLEGINAPTTSATKPY